MVEALPLDISYEDLVAQKLARINSSFDKREASILFNASAANSYEQVQMLATMATFAELMFAETAPREYLILLAQERGLTPDPATKARLKGVFNKDIPLGTRFSLDELNYVAVEQLATGEFVLECETFGEIGNQQLGTLIPIDYVDGLISAELTAVLIPGEDEEDTEVFRQRYFDSFESIAFGGNRADYKAKTTSLAGVGGVKVVRAWNGGGTVKLIIIDSQFEQPTQLLVDTVQEAADPLDNQGEGLGYAPLDHIVTVVACGKSVINIAFPNITYQNCYSWAAVEADVLAAIDAYFKELAKEWAEAKTKEDDERQLVVRIAQLEYRLLGITGIIDVSDTTLNGLAANVELPPENIPERGTVNG